MRSPMRLFLVLFATLASGCAGSGLVPDVDPPRVSLANLELLESGTLEQRFRITLRVRNPNPFPLPITGFSFDLDVNGRSFADGVNNTATLIPRLGEEIVVVDASTSFLQVAQIIMGLPGRDTLSYGISGQVFLQRSMGLSVPFSEDGELSLPTSTGATRLYERARLRVSRHGSRRRNRWAWHNGFVALQQNF